MADANQVITVLRNQLEEARFQNTLLALDVQQSNTELVQLREQYEPEDPEKLNELANEYLSKYKAAIGQAEGPGKE